MPRLNRENLAQDPFEQFELWMAEAKTHQSIKQPYAMTLATATKTGVPSARTVLLRGVDIRGFVFYTNYDSQKSQELSENPQAALVFYWAPLDRQIRITGQISKVTDQESDDYFQTRPRGSQVGAWSSSQSQKIDNRSILEQQVKGIEDKFENQPVTRPPFWGGFRLSPTTIDFWQSGENRLHDWFRYTNHAETGWQIDRLSP